MTDNHITTTKTAGENWVETLELDEVLEALALLEKEGDDVFPVVDRAGLVKVLKERLGHLVREELHGHPELFVQLPDGRWWLREDPPDGAA